MNYLNATRNMRLKRLEFFKFRAVIREASKKQIQSIDEMRGDARCDVS